MKLCDNIKSIDEYEHETPRTEARQAGRGAHKNQISSVEYFFNGAIPLRYTLWLMLPYLKRPKKNEVFILFGKPFVVPEGEGMKEFLSLVSSIIVANQYHIELVKGNVIDAGANMGMFSIFSAEQYPDATIIQL